MEDLETGRDKIQKICDILKNETLEPAKQQAQGIIEEAEVQAHTMIRAAEKKVTEMIQSAQEQIEKERKLFQGQLTEALRQALEVLRQDIEQKLFNTELVAWVDKQTQDPKVGEKLITALVSAIEKEGTSADFSAYIPQSVPAEKVNALLAKQILSKLREKGVQVGDFKGGVQIKLHDRKLTLDLGDGAIVDLLARYLRKDFRELLFA